MSIPYRRILLKLSGEALAGKQGFGFDAGTLDSMAQAVSEARQSGVQIGIVTGGGNIFRGQDSVIASDRVSADQMGMLATYMNALALKGSFEKAGVPCAVLGAVAIPTVVEGFHASKARDLLDQGNVVVFAGGTGNPFFTTDTAAALRALEIKADALIKATKVDGVYDKDPVKHVDAVFYPELDYDQVLQKNLQVMDLTAISLCRDNGLVVRVINIRDPRNLKKVLDGEAIGSVVRARRDRQ
ncbi:MAG: UMP kinase [Deltaproteobacteria bacterium]|nr:UMP kinase [Deltaproteobacteria bacterium]